MKKLMFNRNKIIIMLKIKLARKNKQILINKLQGKLKVDPIKYLIICLYKCRMNNFKEIMPVERF